MRQLRPRLFALAAGLGLSLAAQAGDATLSLGRLEGRSGHQASGTVALVRTARGLELEFKEDFRFDGAPAPRLGFGQQGFERDSRFAPLEHNEGRQRYPLPARLERGKLGEFWLWCDQYDVPIAYAKLNKPKG